MILFCSSQILPDAGYESSICQLGNVVCLIRKTLMPIPVSTTTDFMKGEHASESEEMTEKTRIVAIVCRFAMTRIACIVAKSHHHQTRQFGDSTCPVHDLLHMDMP